MKTTISNILLCTVVALSIVSCNMNSTLLPLAQGKEGEVLIVIDKHLWGGACGDTIRRVLGEPVPGLPAPEPMFTLLQQDALSGFMEKFRNVLVVSIDPGYEATKLSPKTNVYAQNQLIFTVQAPSADSAAACVLRNKDVITAKFLEKDRDSYIDYYRKIVSEQIGKKLNEKFHVDICVPKEYSLGMEQDDFVWLSREEGEKIWGLLIWTEPYTAKSQLTADNLIAKMNQMTRKYVSGKDPGSYMADEPTVPPVVKIFEKDGNYCVQMNGLWQMEKGFMGGPYVNLSMVDLQHKQIVTGVGFVFYPNRDKRQYIRQLEAILYTMAPASASENK